LVLPCILLPIPWRVIFAVTIIEQFNSSYGLLSLRIGHVLCNLSGSPGSIQVLKESFKIYCAINDGIINLVDKVY